MAFGGLRKNCLCESCEGCNKLDNDNFYGLFKCDNYIKSTLISNNSEKEYNPKAYTKSSPKLFIIELNDAEEGIRFINSIISKHYIISTLSGDIEGEIIAVFHCYDDRSKEYGSGYEVKTKNALIRTEILNLFRGN